VLAVRVAGSDAVQVVRQLRPVDDDRARRDGGVRPTGDDAAGRVVTAEREPDQPVVQHQRAHLGREGEGAGRASRPVQEEADRWLRRVDQVDAQARDAQADRAGAPQLQQLATCQLVH
jgi:hypothetical protein